MKAEEGMKGCQRLHSHEGCADIMHELRKVGQVPLLTSRPGSREPAQGMAERLVVSEDEELPTLQLEAEMVDRSKQFPVKRHCSKPQRVTASWRRRRAGPMINDENVVGLHRHECWICRP